MMRRMRRSVTLRAAAWWLAGGCLLASGVACGPNRQTAGELLRDYANAVQQSDWDRLFCLSAGAADAEELGPDLAARRVAFAAFAAGEVEAYLEERETGWIELAGHGIREVKLFALGKGTFHAVLEVTAEGDAVRARSRLNFGYGHIDLSPFSPGTTFYLSSAPVGRVESVRVPAFRSRRSVDVLDQLELVWTLARQGPVDGCDGAGWAVVGVEAVEGSDVVTEVSWNF